MHARTLAMGVALLACAVARAHEPGEPEENEEDAPRTRTAPVLVESVNAEYPEEARKQGLGATVTLEIDIAADGAVTAVRVVRGAGFGFDAAAVAAAKRFKFKPAMERGKPIPSTVVFDQSFVVRPHL